MDIAKIREDFPILTQDIHGHPLIYLDNAATMQIPIPVLDAIDNHYRTRNANVHRGIHTLSEASTQALEDARSTVAQFINAQSPAEIIFTSGTTSSLNMAAGLLESELDEANGVLVSIAEHHSNFVPWQQACTRRNAPFRSIGLTENGDIDLAQLERSMSTGQFRLIAICHVSNVIGTVNPIGSIARMAHAYNMKVIVDAAQSIRHESLDVQALDCDYLAFSGHKMGAPTGIGVLYGKASLLEKSTPIWFGGEMVDQVHVDKSTFERIPLRFEPGTPNYVGAIGLAAAIDYLEKIGCSKIADYERNLLAHAEDRLRSIDRLNLMGNPKDRAGCLSFTVEGGHPFDIAMLCDKLGLAMRSGSQCAQPLLDTWTDVGRVTRLSPAFYNTYAEIDAAAGILERIIPLISRN